MSKTTTITVDKDSKELLNQIKSEIYLKTGIPCTNRIVFDYMIKYVHINKEKFLAKLFMLGDT